jgi:hypothetical protein
VIPEDEIRERAHDIWERHHRPEGFEVQFWFMAERELRAERRTRLDQEVEGTTDAPAAGAGEALDHEPEPIPAEEITDPNPTRIGER